MLPKLDIELNVLSQVLDCLQNGQSLVLATVIDTWGSSPRPVGSEMFITQNGEIQGSLSGGCIEASVVGEAMALFGGGDPIILEFGVSNERAWEVGLSCGGMIKVHLEHLTSQDKDFITQLQKIIRLRRQRMSMMWVRDLLSSFRVVLSETGETFGSGAVETEHFALSGIAESRLLAPKDGRHIFLHHFEPKVHLIIIGAVHVAQCLVKLAEALDFKVTVIDPRRAWAHEARFGDTDCLIGWPDAAMAEIGLDRWTAIAALSHDPKIDDPGLLTALASEAFYIGALGSNRTHTQRLERLRESELDAAELQRIHGPIGLKIGAKTPNEIALAILAQVVAQKSESRLIP
ncbi:MAG: XdhC family protein [Pseudomonadota bacterium]